MFRPRSCNTSLLEDGGATGLVGACPGFPPVTVTAAAGSVFTNTAAGASVVLQLAPAVGGTVAFIAATAVSPQPHDHRVQPTAVVAAARARLVQSYSKFGTHNET